MPFHNSQEIRRAFHGSRKNPLPPSLLCSDDERDWKQECFENGTVIFGCAGPTSQRRPPWEVDHLDWKISTRREAFHLSKQSKFNMLRLRLRKRRANKGTDSKLGFIGGTITCSWFVCATSSDCVIKTTGRKV